jgi:hypothetical protein
MKLRILNNNRNLFLFLGIIVFVPIGIRFFYLFKGFSFSYMADMYNQSADIKMLLKQLSTVGTLGFLSFFSFIYSCIGIKILGKNNIFLNYTFIVLGMGSFGYLFSHQAPLQFNEEVRQFNSGIHHPSRFRILVKFKFFSNEFKKDLQAAADGKYKVYLNHRVSWDPKQAKVFLEGKVIEPVSLNPMSPQQVSLMLNSKQLEFTIESYDGKFTVRDLKGSPLLSRSDHLFLNDTEVMITRDKVFPIYFYILDLKGKIKKVYL